MNETLIDLPGNTTLAYNETYLNVTNTTTSGSPGGGGRPAFYFPWNNPENIVQKEISDDFAYGMQCVIFPILTVFGLTGNILSLIVLFQKKIRNSTTSIVLIGLALSDMAFLITNMCRKSTCIISQVDELASDTWNAVSFRYIFYLKLVFSRVSTLLVVLISVERFIAVSFPLKIRDIVNRKRMTMAVVACYVITFVGIGGIPFQYTYAYIRGNPVISNTQFARENADSLKIYNEYFLPIFFRYIPVLVVLFLNISIIILLRRSKQFKKTAAKGSDKSDDQRKVTRMLLTVAIIYLICLIPGDAVLIAADIDKKFRFFGNYHNLFLIISDISLLFELVNSSINFIIYMVLNKNFYNIYVSLFCSCLKRIKRPQKTTDKKKRIEEAAPVSMSVNSKSGDTKDTDYKSGPSSENDSSNINNAGITEGYENEAFEK